MYILASYQSSPPEQTKQNPTCMTIYIILITVSWLSQLQFIKFSVKPRDVSNITKQGYLYITLTKQEKEKKTFLFRDY